MPVDVFALLIDDATCGKSGSIYFYLSESLRCSNGQDWFSSKGSLKLVEGLLLGGTPDKLNVFPGKTVERVTDLGEVFDEASIEVGKANEALYFFEAFRDGPINNGDASEIGLSPNRLPRPLFCLRLISQT
jgi:hypothetical protein